MNARFLILAASLIANIALGFLYSRHLEPAAPRAASPTVQASVVPIAAAPALPPLDGKFWDGLQAGDDATFVARLRAEGFPPAIVRVLAEARIRKRFADRLRALRPPGQDNYWQRQTAGNYFDRGLTPEARVERRAIDREIRAALKQALGPEVNDLTPEDRAARQRDYGDMPREKADQIKAIMWDYGDLFTQVRDRMQNVTLPEDREQLRLLDAERRADIVALLTPEELLEYDLRSSPSASTIRGRTTYFNPDEAEFRALTMALLDFERRYPSSNASETELARRHTAEPELTAAIQRVLTPGRFAEYQLVSDPAFRNSIDFFENYNHDAAMARQVFLVQKDIAQRAGALRNQALDAGSREAATAALFREAAARIGALLGSQVTEAYEKNGSGQWLARLRAPPAKPEPGKP